MTKEELKNLLKKEMGIHQTYFKEHRKHWISLGIDLDEVQAKTGSSQAELTNAHRNDASIRVYKNLLDLLNKDV